MTELNCSKICSDPQNRLGHYHSKCDTEGLADNHRKTCKSKFSKLYSDTKKKCQTECEKINQEIIELREVNQQKIKEIKEFEKVVIQKSEEAKTLQKQAVQTDNDASELLEKALQKEEAKEEIAQEKKNIFESLDEVLQEEEESQEEFQKEIAQQKKKGIYDSLYKVLQKEKEAETELKELENNVIQKKSEGRELQQEANRTEKEAVKLQQAIVQTVKEVETLRKEELQQEEEVKKIVLDMFKDTEKKAHEIESEFFSNSAKDKQSWVKCATQVKNKVANKAMYERDPLVKKWLQNAEKECNAYENEKLAYHENQNWMKCATTKGYNYQAFNELVKQANKDCWNENIQPAGLIEDLASLIKTSKGHLRPVEDWVKCATKSKNTKSLFDEWLKSAEKNASVIAMTIQIGLNVQLQQIIN